MCIDCLHCTPHSLRTSELRQMAAARPAHVACVLTPIDLTALLASHHSLEIPVARRGDICHMERVSWYRVQPALNSSRRAYRNVPAWLRRALGLGKPQDAAAIAQIVREARAPNASAKPRIVHGSDEQVVLPP